MKNFTVYSISTNGVVFYIGRTSDFKRRKSEHLYEKKKTYKGNKINKLKRLGLPIEFNILHEIDDFDLSTQLEINEIKEHRERGVELTNLTNGGEGTIGHKPIFTEEWKAKLKDSRKKLFDNGYIVVNKGKKLEELIGFERAKEIKDQTSKRVSEGIKNGTIRTNKGKKLEEIVTHERAEELRKISSKNAIKNFTGKKQSESHINARISSQKKTVGNWSEEEKINMRKRNKLAQLKSVKHYFFTIDKHFEHYGTWKSLSLALKEELGINVGEGSLSQFYRGIYKSLKCGITDIKVNLSQSNEI